MTLQITNITNEIAALTVTGVAMKEIDEMQDNPGIRDTPCLMPKPDGFVTDFEVERDSFGSASQARKTVTYTLNYTFMYAALGSGRLNLEAWTLMVSKAFAILDAIIAWDATKAVEAVPTAGQFGPVVDPAGNAYHGCIISVNVTEFVN